jgi:hypothetical protein
LQRLSGTTLSIRPFMGLGFTQSSSPAPESVRGDIFSKGTNGEPAVLAGVLIVLRGAITRRTEWDEQGAFAIDGPRPGPYQIEAEAPELYEALAVEVSAGSSSTIPLEMNVSAVTSATPPQLTRLKAMDVPLAERVQRHA